LTGINRLIKRFLGRTATLFKSRQFCSQLLELEKALDLEFLSVNYTLAVLIDDIDIREQVLNDRLQPRVLNL